MKISGVIVEYNPMHNGHVFHLNKTRELTGCDVIIAVMSGNFAQRGIPSVIDKWNKTKIALKSGADIVLELPAIYSLSSAEFFSYGSISLLNSLGAVDSICFGSECGDIDFLSKASHILNGEPESFKEILKSELKKGLTFPKARSTALIESLSSFEGYSSSEIADMLGSSNNILSMEYIKSILKLGSSIKPYTIKREGGSYNSEGLDSEFSSATSIRRALKSNDGIGALKSHVPSATFETLLSLSEESCSFPSEELMFPYIKYKSLASRYNTLINLPDISEGLDNKIADSIAKAQSYEQCIDLIKSKRYARTRISRLLCQYFIGFDGYDTDSLRRNKCPYARLLGFNSKGAAALKYLKSNSEIPIYSKLPKTLDECMELDLHATKGYSLLNPSVNPNQDYLTSPIIVK